MAAPAGPSYLGLVMRLPAWVTRVQERPRVLDAGLAIVVLDWLLWYVVSDDGYLTGPRWAYLTASVVMTIPLALRRTAPLGVLVVVLGGLVGETLVVAPAPTMDAEIPALLVAVYSAAAHAARARAWLGLVLSLAAGVVWVGVDDLLLPVMAFGGAWAAGRTVRTHKAAADLAQEHAETLARERDATMRAVAAEERTRIARELHDVVAHTVGVMVVQAGAERMHAAPGSGSHTAFATIEESGRAALEQMGRLLGMLRGQGDPDALHPQPGLAGLDELVSAVAPAGLTVDVVESGAPRALGPDVDLSAYRIIQEALTNAVRHGRATRAEVRLRWESRALVIEVLDDGSGPGQEPARLGHGLVGIAERVALFGGTMATGRSELGGFFLTARLPAVAP